MGESAIGIDVGATNIKAGLVRPDGKVLQELRRETRAGQGVEPVVGAIGDLCQALRSSDAPSCIGVGVPGLVDSGSGLVRIPPNLPGWKEVPLRAILMERLKTPVFVGNDVNMITYGEWRFGAGRGVDDLLVIAVGSGVGGGIVAGGSLQLGRHGLAGEIGHTTVDPDGPLCNCGNYGCLESFVGSEYVKHNAIALINKGVTTVIAQLVEGNLDLVSPEVIATAAAAGDRLAKTLIDKMGEHLGIALANAISLLDPDRVVVGGGVARAGELLFRSIRDTIINRLYSYVYTGVEVVPAELGDNGGVVGAATYAMTYFRADRR